MGGYDISSSVSESAAAKQGGAFGDFVFNAGGGKQASQLLLLLGAIVVVAGIVAVMLFKGGR